MATPDHLGEHRGVRRQTPLLLVMMFLAALSGLYLLDRVNHQKRTFSAADEARRFATRTRYSSTPPPLRRDTTGLPSIARFAPDGMRVFLDPTFNPLVYAVGLRDGHDGKPATGVLIRVAKDHSGRIGSPVSRREFSLPVPAYRSLARRIDRMLADNPGDPSPCVDGTSIAIERIVAGRFASASSACGDTLGDMTPGILATLRTHAPGPDLPSEPDWMDPS